MHDPDDTLRVVVRFVIVRPVISTYGSTKLGSKNSECERRGAGLAKARKVSELKRVAQGRVARRRRRRGQGKTEGWKREESGEGWLESH